jgi:diguanylate cyclase (GGDEF)-like protein/PAS domain S-box-containing protein
MDSIFGIGPDYERTVEGWMALIHPDDRTMITTYFEQEVLGAGKDFQKEYRILRRSDQSEHWIRGVGRLAFDAQGKPKKMHGYVKDITESKLSEIQLRDSEERLRSTFEQAAIGIVHVSFEGKILGCNPRFAAIVGYSAEELTRMTFRQLTPVEYLQLSEEVLEGLVVGEQAAPHWEKPYIRRDGSLTWVRLTTSIQFDGQGKPLHLVSFVEDINAHKEAETRLAETQEALKLSEDRFRSAFQNSPNMVSIARLEDGMLLEINNIFLETFGFERGDVIGRTSIDLDIWVDPGERQEMANALGRGEVYKSEVRLKRVDGSLLWGRLSASVFQHNGIPCYLTLVQDISEFKAAQQRLDAAQEALRASEQRYRTVFEASLAFCAINRLSDGMYIDANRAFFDITGFQREEVIGQTWLELEVWADPKDRLNFVKTVRRETNCRNLECRFRKKNGEIFSGLVSASIIEIEGVACLVSMTRDLSDAKIAAEQIRDLALYDPLTHLPNRRLLLDRLSQTPNTRISRRKRALLFIDLDDFKTLNDTLGHQTGDLMLKEVAARLVTTIRDADTVARLGSDEFVVMLEHLSDVAEEAASHAETVAEKIRVALGKPYLLADRNYHKTCCIGIAIFGAHPGNPLDVLQQAEIAMSQAKAAGRNTVRFFAPALQASATDRVTMEEDLYEAIKARQFQLYYQPQVKGTKLVGVEALVRWKHPVRGILSPGDFIPLAEETGLILPLGDWILETACRQAAAWSSIKEMAHIPVAVNISARQFRQPGFVEEVLGTLVRTGANPRSLELELTETMLVEDFEEVIDKMRTLKFHGLAFSMDDFGTGYSSLAYLKRLPLDQLKIDRAFIRDIQEDPASGAIAQTIISLGRALGLSVVAEGVETEEQRKFLSRLGCNSFQGYLFSPPLPADEFEIWLKDFSKSSGPILIRTRASSKR